MPKSPSGAPWLAPQQHTVTVSVSMRSWAISASSFANVVLASYCYDTCISLVKSDISNKPFQTVCFPAAVFNIDKHAEQVFKGNFLKLGLIYLSTECICHGGQAAFPLIYQVYSGLSYAFTSGNSRHLLWYRVLSVWSSCLRFLSAVFPNRL